MRLNLKPEFNRLTQQLIKMWLDSGSSGYPNDQENNISYSALLVRGDNNPIVSKTDLVELSGLVKNSRILNIPDAGHAAFTDRNEMFMKNLRELLEGYNLW